MKDKASSYALPGRNDAPKLYGADFLDVILRDGSGRLSIGEDIVMLPEGEFVLPQEMTFETDYMMVIHITSGKMLMKIDGREHFIRGGSLLELKPHQPIRMSCAGGTLPKMEGVAFSERYIRSNFDVAEKVLTIHQFMLDEPVFAMSDTDVAEFSLYLRSMRHVIGKEKQTDKVLCCTGLTMSLFISMLLPMTASTTDSSSRDLAAMKVSVRFMELLKRHYREEHNPGFYADALGVSPTHLLVSLKKETGRTANDWINTLLVSDAKKMLLDPELSVAAISDALCFKTQSDFGKFFKRREGMSPLVWRRDRLCAVQP